MKFGIIGFGRIARKFVKSITYTSEGVVTAIASRSLDLQDEYCVLHPEVHIYRNYQDILEDDSIEAVYIALPHQEHKEWIIKALKKGIAVFSEKPMVLSVEDAREIQNLANSKQVTCMEAFKTKFNVGFDHLKEDLSLLGKITKIEANFCSDAVSRIDYDSYLFKEEQGGALYDIGSYVIGFVRALCPETIKSMDARMKMVKGIDHYFKATLTLENGTQAIVEGAIDRAKERTAYIEGEKGRIIIPIYNRITDYQIVLANEVIKRQYPIIGDDMTLEIETFIQDVKNKQVENAIHSLDNTIEILQITEQIRKVAILDE